MLLGIYVLHFLYDFVESLRTWVGMFQLTYENSKLFMPNNYVQQNMKNNYILIRYISSKQIWYWLIYINKYTMIIIKFDLSIYI